MKCGQFSVVLPSQFRCHCCLFYVRFFSQLNQTNAWSTGPEKRGEWMKEEQGTNCICTIINKLKPIQINVVTSLYDILPNKTDQLEGNGFYLVYLDSASSDMLSYTLVTAIIFNVRLKNTIIEFQYRGKHLIKLRGQRWTRTI